MGLSLLSDSSPPRLLMRPWASFEGKKPGAMMLLVMCLGPSSTERLRARCCGRQLKFVLHQMEGDLRLLRLSRSST